MTRPPECPDCESVGFCLICPFFGPAFYSVGMCTRPRFLVSLALWLLLVSALAALITRYQVTHPKLVNVAPASQHRLDSSVINSRLWCSNVQLQLMTKVANTNPAVVLSFQAFPSAKDPEIDRKQRLKFGLSRLIAGGAAPPGQPLWMFPLPLTPNSSIDISLAPFGGHNSSAFRLTVLTEANRSCWEAFDDLAKVPAKCALLHSLVAPLKVSVRTSNDTGEKFFILVWSAEFAEGFSVRATIFWNASRFIQPPRAPQAGPLCKQSAPLGVANTPVCTLAYSGYSDHSDRRVVVVEIGPVNRTDLQLRAECGANSANYFVFFVLLPILGWGLVALALVAYRWYKDKEENRLTGEDHSDLEVSTDFRPRRRLKSSSDRSAPNDETSVLLRSMTSYQSQDRR